MIEPALSGLEPEVEVAAVVEVEARWSRERDESRSLTARHREANHLPARAGVPAIPCRSARSRSASNRDPRAIGHPVWIEVLARRTRHASRGATGGGHHHQVTAPRWAP